MLVTGPADLERRRRSVAMVSEASAYLSRAYDSLQATIESGVATLVTTPGVQHILEMLQHRRDGLAATRRRAAVEQAGDCRKLLRLVLAYRGFT